MTTLLRELNERTYQAGKYQRFRANKKDYILCQKSSAIYEADEISTAILNVFDQKTSVSLIDFKKALPTFSSADVIQGLEELLEANIIRPKRDHRNNLKHKRNERSL